MSVSHPFLTILSILATLVMLCDNLLQLFFFIRYETTILNTISTTRKQCAENMSLNLVPSLKLCLVQKLLDFSMT